MPTFAHGKKAVFKIADSGGTMRDVSAVLNTASLARSCDAAEITAFGADDKAYIPGLRDATVPIGGMCSATEEGYFVGVFGGTATPAWEFYPMGSASTLLKYTGTCVLTKFQSDSDLGDAVKVSGELQVSGTVTRTVL